MNETKKPLDLDDSENVPNLGPELELRELPDNLKYVFLGDNNTLPVIISAKSTGDQENKLLKVLREFKGAIGLSIDDIKGISPTKCTHKIILEDEVKPVRQPQMRLNPNMQELVKKEISNY